MYLERLNACATRKKSVRTYSKTTNTATMDKSHFGRLSPEIRNHVYQLALYECRPVAISKDFWTEPALLRVCKQIRQEAEPMFYSINDFTCVTNLRDDNSKRLVHWLTNDQPHKLSLIRSLKIMAEFPGLDFSQRIPIQTRRSDAESGDFLKVPLFTQLRTCVFGKRPMECVVKVDLNGRSDSLSENETKQFIDNKRRAEHFGAEILMMAAVYGDNLTDMVKAGDVKKYHEMSQSLRDRRRHGAKV